jgi:hypothetical protein
LLENRERLVVGVRTPLFVFVSFKPTNSRAYLGGNGFCCTGVAAPPHEFAFPLLITRDSASTCYLNPCMHEKRSVPWQASCDDSKRRHLSTGDTHFGGSQLRTGTSPHTIAFPRRWIAATSITVRQRCVFSDEKQQTCSILLHSCLSWIDSLTFSLPRLALTMTTKTWIVALLVVRLLTMPIPMQSLDVMEFGRRRTAADEPRQAYV